MISKADLPGTSVHTDSEVAGSASFVGLVLFAQVAIAVSKPLLIHPPHLRTTIPQHVHVQLPGGYAQEDVVS